MKTIKTYVTNFSKKIVSNFYSKFSILKCNSTCAVVLKIFYMLICKCIILYYLLNFTRQKRSKSIKCQQKKKEEEVSCLFAKKFKIKQYIYLFN